MIWYGSPPLAPVLACQLEKAAQEHADVAGSIDG